MDVRPSSTRQCACSVRVHRRVRHLRWYDTRSHHTKQSRKAAAMHLHRIRATVLQDERVDLLNGVPELVVRVVRRQLQLRDQPVQLGQHQRDRQALGGGLRRTRPPLRP